MRRFEPAPIVWHPLPSNTQSDLRGCPESRRAGCRLLAGKPDFHLRCSRSTIGHAIERSGACHSRRAKWRRPSRPCPESGVQPRWKHARIRRISRREILVSPPPHRAGDNQRYACHVIADCMAQSPNGKALAIAGEDHVIRIYSIPAGKLLRELKGHTGAITGIAFADGGATLYSASLDKTIRVWKTSEGAGDPVVIETDAEVLALAVIGQGKVGDSRARTRRCGCGPTASSTSNFPRFNRSYSRWRRRRMEAIGSPWLPRTARFASGMSPRKKSCAIAIRRRSVGDFVQRRRQDDFVPSGQTKRQGFSASTESWRPCPLASIATPPTASSSANADSKLPIVKLPSRRADSGRDRTSNSETQSIARGKTDLATAEKALAEAKKTAEAKALAKKAVDKELVDADAEIVEATKNRDATIAAATAAKAAVEDFRPLRDKARAAVDSASKADAKDAAAALADAQKTYAELKAKSEVGRAGAGSRPPENECRDGQTARSPATRPRSRTRGRGKRDGRYAGGNGLEIGDEEPGGIQDQS